MNNGWKRYFKRGWKEWAIKKRFPLRIKIFFATKEEVIVILTEAKEQGYKWRSTSNPLEYIPTIDKDGIILCFDRDFDCDGSKSKVITFLTAYSDEKINEFNAISVEDILRRFWRCLQLENV